MSKLKYNPLSKVQTEVYNKLGKKPKSAEELRARIDTLLALERKGYAKSVGAVKLPFNFSTSDLRELKFVKNK